MADGARAGVLSEGLRVLNKGKNIAANAGGICLNAEIYDLNGPEREREEAVNSDKEEM